MSTPSTFPCGLRVLALSLLTVAVLTACGGGSDNSPGAVPGLNSQIPGSGNGGAIARSTLALTLTNGAGAATNFLSVSAPLTATAVLKDAAGKPIPNALVAFSADPALATMAPSAGTVLTDSEGKATVRLTAPSLQASGAGLLKVAATVGEQAVLAETTFSIGAPNISLRVVSPTASPSLLKAYGSGVITLDVLGDGKLLVDDTQSINLASPCVSAGKASLASEVRTINGRAQVVYRDLGCAQSDTVTASIVGSSATAKLSFQISPPDAASIDVATIAPADRSIVIKGSGGSGRSESATVTFRVVDQFGNPLANQKVTFATISTKAVGLSKTTDVTDAAGEVSTAVTSGTEPTAVRVQATLDGGLSTISDSITVTTGLPIQAAFSLSSETYNIEGWQYDNIQTELLLLLADQFGNPVADGTPVVFQTDSGAVGTSDRGGCTTVNGSCSVPLRSQNPRYPTDAGAPRGRAGMATVTVSTSDNTTVPLTGQLRVFFSGSHAYVTRIQNGSVSPVTAEGIKLLTASCAPTQVEIRVSDVNRNPMPSDTALEPTVQTNLVAAILPAAVPSKAPVLTNGVVVGDQGTRHLITLTPDAGKCVEGGAAKATGSTQVTITTPLENVTSFPVTLTYPAATP
ncbi:Ig-like domain-containing protein [Massilia sp.]|uniref:Ig-like domain-containing protein n=1 Tax=Massilia sp. TaxID=1882437 RepID=UPI0028B02267|nr:Ig-like domain-containing protein [Massilia sp.]